MSDAISIIAALQARRRIEVTVKHMVFLARRPTDLELGHINDPRAGDLAQRFVDGWRFVRVCDVSPEPMDSTITTEIAFSRALWEEWCADQPDVLNTVGRAVMEAYVAHAKASEENAKN